LDNSRLWSRYNTILKNSFLFGFVFNKYSFNIVPSIKNSILAGFSAIYNAFTYLTIAPEILLNWHLYTTKKIIFIIELFLSNEFLFYKSSGYIRNSNYIDIFNSTLCVGFSFGVSFTNK